MMDGRPVRNQAPKSFHELVKTCVVQSCYVLPRFLYDLATHFSLVDSYSFLFLMTVNSGFIVWSLGTGQDKQHICNPTDFRVRPFFMQFYFRCGLWWFITLGPSSFTTEDIEGNLFSSLLRIRFIRGRNRFVRDSYHKY